MGNIKILGEAYEKNIDIEVRKAMGQYYTPSFVIKYILENTLDKVDIVENPFIKVIDISCGAGYFLLESYDMLKEKFLANVEELKVKYKDTIYKLNRDGKAIELNGSRYWKEENIHYHLLRHCIYGADKDGQGVELTKLGLISKNTDEDVGELNVIKCDSLVKWERDFNWKDIKEQLENNGSGEKYSLEYINVDGNWVNKIVTKEKAMEIYTLGKFWSEKYHIVIGNPPYIGHKQLDNQYKEWLLKEYKNVFRDKSDLSFCFFERMIDILSLDGTCGIITSRYFMESPTGRQLRSFLQENIDILKIVDFYGGEIFKGAGIATAIYFFKRKGTEKPKTIVKKLKDDSYVFDDREELKKILEREAFEKFNVTEDVLTPDRWILLPRENVNIFNKIEKKTKHRLSDIGISFQGVITGRDRAFVLDSNEINKYKIEKDLLKPWIKNSDVRRYEILHRDQYLIYSNLIENEKDYPNSIAYIGQHKDRLENRRECKNGIRKWYELQWGREERLFEQSKIVVPYKANSNRFAIDYHGRFSSADVYSIIIKDEFADLIPLEYLLALLNSRIYEFYFKSFAKKMGRGIYDYYPNSVMDMKIITEDIVEDITKLSKKIIELTGNKDLNNEKKIKNLEEDINMIIVDYLDLSVKEYELTKAVIN